jgi:hypothetical protein
MPLDDAIHLSGDEYSSQILRIGVRGFQKRRKGEDCRMLIDVLGFLIGKGRKAPFHVLHENILAFIEGVGVQNPWKGHSMPHLFLVAFRSSHRHFS